MKSWTEISGERLAANFTALERILSERLAGDGQAALLAVVKANAYGHGIGPCVPVLAAAGARWLGVTDAHEGAGARAALRAGGIDEAETPTSERQDAGRPNAPPVQPRILVMCGTAGLSGEAECIVRDRLTAVVWDAGHLQRLAEAARAAGLEEPVSVHLEVDSGMSRQGVPPGAALDAILRAIAAEPRVVLDGVLTHFASAEVAASPQTAAQQRCFAAAVAQVAASGLRPQWVHVGNSSYIDNPPAALDAGSCPSTWLPELARRLGARPMVRSGLALYGYLLPIEGGGVSLAGPSVLPVMTWKTRVIGVREVAAGALVGYNGTFVAQRPMRLALLPVGYADGLRRELSSACARPGGWVILRGKPAPIVGRVSMNLTTVDVTGIGEAVEGDEVVLLGEGVTAEHHARLAGTIPYEILCAVRTTA